MKTLHYRRHSLKEGNYITLKGMILSGDEGHAMTKRGINFEKLFHSPFLRTLQTAYSFCQGLQYQPVLMPVVKEIGNQKWFDELVANGAYMKAVDRKKTHLEALYAASENDQALRNSWGEIAHRGLVRMFIDMDEGETAIAFGHTPIIELAAAMLPVGGLLPLGWDHLAEMDGLVFVQDRMGRDTGIEVTEIIRAKRF